MIIIFWGIAIKEIVKIENDDNDTSKKADIYKNIIKILDEVTLRGHHQDELDDYKKYYESTKNAVGSPATEPASLEVKCPL